MRQFQLYLHPHQKRGISSFGRALAWHARGDRFDSGILHALSRRKAAFCFLNPNIKLDNSLSDHGTFIEPNKKRDLITFTITFIFQKHH